VFNIKHFSGKSQLPASKITLEMNSMDTEGDLTKTPNFSKLLSSLIIGFRKILMFGLLSPNQRPAKNGVFFQC